jgi:hypothetical protein
VPAVWRPEDGDDALDDRRVELDGHSLLVDDRSTAAS